MFRVSSFKLQVGVLAAAAFSLAAARLSATPAPLRPNLRGEIMILVYHNFDAAKNAQWFRPFSSFDQDLARLDAAGYRPITLRQYITGDTATPAGTTPVVLTFDDGSKYQLRFTPDGKMDPDCAVAHWMTFAKTHPEFPVHGTFFVNPGDTPFGQKQFVKQKLDLLVSLGSEIGNHTYTHPYLRRISDAAVEREIGLGQYYIDRWLPGYDVTSFALPYGQTPHDDALTVAATWTGSPSLRGVPVTVKWHYAAVVLVGSGPAPSPLVAGLDAAHLPRVQVFDAEFNKWMRIFTQDPARRFVSDGQPHPPQTLPAAPRRAARAARAAK